MSTPIKIVKITTGPQGIRGLNGPTGSRGERGPQGPSGSADGSFTRDANDNLFYEDGVVGIGPTFDLVDPSAKLEIRQPVQEGQFGNGNDLFLIKAYDSNTGQVESKFIVNTQGVTVLGAFIEAPTPVSGGMYYNANGNFYLGFD